jgi:hypothetical protein
VETHASWCVIRLPIADVVLAIVVFDEPEAIFSPWTIVYGVPQFTVWALGLFLATRSYSARTAISMSAPQRLLQ